MLREPDIDLEKAIKLGQAAEVTRKHAKNIQTQSDEKSTSAVIKTGKDRKASHHTKGKVRQKFSNVCSATHTQQGQLPAFNKHCNTCSRRGNFSTCCSQKTAKAINKDVASEPPSDSEPEDHKNYFVGTVHQDY